LPKLYHKRDPRPQASRHSRRVRAPMTLLEMPLRVPGGLLRRG